MNGVDRFDVLYATIVVLVAVTMSACGLIAATA
jgi:hypothetical protein